MVFYCREVYRCLKSLCTQCKACVKNPHKEEAAVNDSSFNTSDFASPLQPVTSLFFLSKKKSVQKEKRSIAENAFLSFDFP